MMKQETLHYGGYFKTYIRSKWLTIRYIDYTENTVVKSTIKCIEIYSRLWGNKRIKFK